ncbi:hypothetical protein CBQ28_15040 [Pseudoalteromonas sp. GCY]|uniref:putative phage abortive infection protein n=1 Tax=Pseudoalteromonas sp. GCY TaxID=2003316 RepID=UPI000BFEE06E|nr:putative phage abortive infection protein [Pseudoalteromonas sp. GCY]PHI36321.1 hypothetical protein CBQ28_15040 [Pseudoalteromonas sp. GCY]QQQ66919.1 putative phage abortive infection protein [Pseudoalteromonas sp. GCY]
MDKMVKKMKGLWEKKYSSFQGMLMDSGESKEDILLHKVLFTIISLAIAIAGLLFLVNLVLIFITDKAGAFGDFFGGILNPILTFFTLFGLIVTIVIQRKEFRLARFEYEKTADALGTTAIETTFFNILDLHHNLVSNLKLDMKELSNKTKAERIFTEIAETFFQRTMGNALLDKDEIVEGREVFETIIKFLTSNSESAENSLERYKFIQNNLNHILGHYFRNLYQALKIINNYDDNKLSEADKRKYTSILRAQLSTKELAILFLNCIEGVSDNGEFKNLLIRYEMLEHLPIQAVEGGYKLAGSEKPLANDEMFLQYQKEKVFDKIDLSKHFGGAFGKNKNVPYKLNRPSQEV